MPDTMTFPMTRQGVRDLDNADRDVLPVSGGRASAAGLGVNMSEAERVLSAVSGSALAVFGLTEGGLLGMSMMLGGGVLAYWGLTGHCPLLTALRMNHSGRQSNAEIVHRAG